MTFRFELTLNIKETAENFSVSGDFSDDEVKVLNNFVTETKEIWQTEFIQNGNYGNLKISSNGENNFVVEHDLPDWNKVVVFLHKFRPILLNDEKTYFYTIHKLLGRKLNNIYLRNSLKIQKNLFSGKTHQSLFQIRSNEILLNSEKVLYDYLNAHEYHRDESKQIFLESLHKLIPMDASKVIFLGLLIDKAKATAWIADLILLIFGKQKELTIKTHSNN